MQRFLNLFSIGATDKESRKSGTAVIQDSQPNETVSRTTKKESDFPVDQSKVPDIIVTLYEKDHKDVVQGGQLPHLSSYLHSQYTLYNLESELVGDVGETGVDQSRPKETKSLPTQSGSSCDQQGAIEPSPLVLQSTSTVEKLQKTPLKGKVEFEDKLDMVSLDLLREGVLIDETMEDFPYHNPAHEPLKTWRLEQGGGLFDNEQDAKMAASAATAVSADNDEDEDEDGKHIFVEDEDDYGGTFLQSDTSEEIDNLPLDYKTKDRASRLQGSNSRDFPGQSIQVDRQQLEEDFENEKDDIVKGFLLEKEIMEEEHKKEKDGLINDFVKEKHDMLQKFHSQVAEIERKLKLSQGSSTQPMLKTSDKEKSGAIVIKLGDQEVLTPDEFLSRLKLEEKFEKEKEEIEREYRKQKKEIVEKIRLDFNSTLIRERMKHESAIEDLKLQIKESENQRRLLEENFKHRTDGVHLEFDKERHLIGEEHKIDLEQQRKVLESQYQEQINKHKLGYECSITELKGELARVSELLNAEKQRFIDYGKRFRLDQVEIRRGLREEVRFEFEKEIRELREENVKLINENSLVSEENMELKEQLRSMETSDEDRSRMLQTLGERLNKEYEEKLKSVIDENEQLSEKIQQLELEKDRLYIAFENCENEEKKLLEKFDVHERTFMQQEEKIDSLRNESEILSKEVSLLRSEKEQLSQELQGSEDTRNQVVKELKLIKASESEEKQRSYRLEQEKLLVEKSIAALRKEIKQISFENDERERQFRSLEEESLYLRKLLESERKEHGRFRQRFEEDANLIRKKEKEIQDLRRRLDEEAQSSSSTKSKHSDLERKVSELEAENSAFRDKLHNVTDAADTLLQQERHLLQQKFTKEFKERVEYMKSSYERENLGLRKNIDFLKRKLSEKNKISSAATHTSRGVETVTIDPSYRDLKAPDIPMASSGDKGPLYPNKLYEAKHGGNARTLHGAKDEQICKEDRNGGTELFQRKPLRNASNMNSRVRNMTYSKVELASQVPNRVSEKNVNSDLYPTKESACEEPKCVSRVHNDLVHHSLAQLGSYNATEQCSNENTNFYGEAKYISNGCHTRHHSAPPSPDALSRIPLTKPPTGNRYQAERSVREGTLKQRVAAHGRHNTFPKFSNFFLKHYDGIHGSPVDHVPVDSSSPKGPQIRSCLKTFLPRAYEGRARIENDDCQYREACGNQTSFVYSKGEIARRLKSQHNNKHCTQTNSNSQESSENAQESSLRCHGAPNVRENIDERDKEALLPTDGVTGCDCISRAPRNSLGSQYHQGVLDNMAKATYNDTLHVDVGDTNFQGNFLGDGGSHETICDYKDLLLKEIRKPVDIGSDHSRGVGLVATNEEDVKCYYNTDSTTNKAYMKLHSKRLETAVEGLSQKMSSEHGELMRALKDLSQESTSSDSYDETQAQKFKSIINKVRTAEKDSKDKEIRRLLKEVRREVLILNTMLEKKERSTSSSLEDSPGSHEFNSTNIQSDSGHESYKEERRKRDIELIEKEAKLARLYASDLQARLEQKDREAQDSVSIIGNLYTENEALHNVIEEKERELSAKQRSCERLLKKRLSLEKAVDRLQRKLKDSNSGDIHHVTRSDNLKSGSDILIDDCTV